MRIPDAEIFKVEEGVRVVLADDLDESVSERNGGSVGCFGMRERSGWRTDRWIVDEGIQT